MNARFSTRRLLAVSGATVACCALALVPWTRGAAPARSGAQPTDLLTSRPRPAEQPPERLSVGNQYTTAPAGRTRLLLPDDSTAYLNGGTGLQVTGKDQVTITEGEALI